MTIYQATLKGTWYSDFHDILNVFHIESSGAFTGGLSVTEILGDIGHGLWRVLTTHGLMTITSETVKYYAVAVKELSGGSNPGAEADYAIPTGDQVGENTAECLPPSAAYSIRFTRPSNQFRHGFKRFAGVPEDKQSAGYVGSSAMAVLDSVGNGLLDGFNPYDSSNAPRVLVTLTYVLQRAVVNGVSLTTPVYGRPIGKVVSPAVSSQNTRKYGRGS